MANWKEIFENNMKQAITTADKWEVILAEYQRLSGLPNHAKQEAEFRYLYYRMKEFAKGDFSLGGLYLLHLARTGTIRELTSNLKLLSLRSAAESCMLELYNETKDRYLALILGIAYYESSIPMPIGYAHARDVAVKYIRLAQEGIQSCSNENLKERILSFVATIQQYEEIKKNYESAKWKGSEKSMRIYLKELESFYEPLKEDPHFDFILRELVTWYSHCEMFSKQYKAILACMERYPGDESLPPLLQLANKRRVSVVNVLKNIPLFLVCMAAVLVLPIIGALVAIAFFQSITAGIVVFLVLLVIRIFMIKGSGGQGIDGSILDFMEGFFWGRM